MYLKTDKDVFINTDQIAYFLKAERSWLTRLFRVSSDWMIRFANGRALVVSDAVAQYLITMLDPNMSLIADASAPPPMLSIGSRIAIFLRNHPNGATFNLLADQLQLDTNALTVALNELRIEGILHIDTYGDVTLYRHASTVLTTDEAIDIDNTSIADAPPDTW